MSSTPTQETMLELYKLYVEMADRISQRRQSANNYFLTINTALISLLIAILAYSRSIKDPNSGVIVVVIVGVALVGMANCWIWHSLIKSYKAMNGAKFKVIHDMEKIIGYRPYFDEWEHLSRGEDKKIYHKFTVVELRVPIVFLAGYLLTTLVSLLWYFIK